MFFDTETTGTQFDAEVAQIAMLLKTDNGFSLGEFNCLVKPDDWIMSDEVTQFHDDNQSAVSMANCNKFGFNSNVIFGAFNFLASKADIICGHNLQFDIDRLSFLAERLGRELYLPAQRICTMESARDIIKIPPTQRMKDFGHGHEYKNPNLRETYSFFFGKEFENAHDAMSDISATAEIFYKLLADNHIKI